MPAAVPIIAVVAAGAVSAAVGGGIIGALAAAGTAIVVSAIGRSVLPAPKPKLPALNLAAPGAGRTQSLRQPITEHRIVLGRAKVSGPIVFLHSATDDEGREHRQVGLVDAEGTAVSHTGAECLPWAGGRTGPGHAIQGNVLVGEQVVEAMALAAERLQELWRALRGYDPQPVQNGGFLAALRARLGFPREASPRDPV